MGAEFAYERLLALVREGKLAGNRRYRRGVRCCRRFDLKQEAIDLTHHHGLAGGHVGKRNGVPEFAVDEYFPSGRKCSLGDASLSHQAFHAGYNFVSPRFQSQGHQERSDETEWNADRERGEQVDAHFGDRGIDEEQSSESE